MDHPPASRLIPPDADAVRAAVRTPRPRARGLGVLVVAALAGAGLSSLGQLGDDRMAAPDQTPAAGDSASPHHGRVELAAAAPLRLADSREAEAELDLVWTSSTAGDLAPGRVDAARAALAAWIGARRPVELTTAADDADLRERLEHALFPDGDGAVAGVALRRIRLR